MVAFPIETCGDLKDWISKNAQFCLIVWQRLLRLVLYLLTLRFGGGFGKVGVGVKRKTPSELRLVDESLAPLLGSTKCIDTRMDGVFPAKKSSLGCFLEKKMLSPENTVASAAVSKDGTRQDCEYAEKCSESTFRSVAELSLGSERISEMTVVDMDKALKGLVACEPGAFSGLAADSSEKFHRLNMSATYNGTTLSTPQFAGCSKDQNISCSSGITSTAQIFNYRALHSWVHPQSSLPPSVISAWTLSAVDGVETDFLIKRQLAWEDSFRSLYYMLRKNICNIFYVCTSQFVVVFAGGDGSGGKKQSSNAYISQSTRGLRSLLREHDVCFSMPLCCSKVEQVTTEDLTRRLGSISDVDNSPQSLLSFCGNKDVRALYDFMLNYSFTTEPTSIGLKAGVETVGLKADTQAATGEAIQESTYAFGIPEAVVTCYMHSVFLKGLEYANGSVTACLSPV
ncbi:hypothetical protein PVL29_006454 [Vitis rotundifolia]|uniref:Protein downstream neighbor of Son n=1 Tax=Vitis rotundifolia TaxID=103349 RepID=A0AA39DZG5_VITRO|nr:hypothetical protein PVL29_006454 [Vitis rotundifolia]